MNKEALLPGEENKKFNLAFLLSYCLKDKYGLILNVTEHQKTGQIYWVC